MQLPSASTATWTSNVTLPTTKHITLDLNGSTITLEASLSVGSHATGLNRLTNGTLSIDFSAGGELNLDDTATGFGLRADHLTITNEGNPSNSWVIVNINGQGPGLFDNNTVSTLVFAQEFVHINGWGSGDTTGWENDTGDDLAGSASLFYMEDNFFETASSQGGVAWIQGYYGSRVVIRHNTFDHVSIDAHGTAGQVGQRWWEVYENTWQNTNGGTSGGWAFSARAGSGVVFNNADLDGRYNLGFCEEDSGYPADYQIGRGRNQEIDPAYVWDNSANMAVEPDECDAPEQAGMVQLDRDIFASERPGYTSYTYPHPARSIAP